MGGFLLRAVKESVIQLPVSISIFMFTVSNKNIYIQFSVNLVNMRHGFTHCGLDILQGLT